MEADPRIPVRFGCREEADADSALLVEGVPGEPRTGPVAYFMPGPAAGHSVGCACCVPRRPAAEALARLFLAHVRNGRAPFTAVLVLARTGTGRRAVLEALNADMLTKARFRLAEPPPREGGTANR